MSNTTDIFPAKPTVKDTDVTGSTILTPLMGLGIALLRSTLRVEVLHSRHYTELQARHVPILFALWHGRMFLPIDAHRHQSIVTMASKSLDGNIVARWLENNGYLVTRGSTSRGGSEALRRMVRQVRLGHNVALTVDGPRGPAHVVQAGVVRLARITGAWILPISFSSSWPLFLRSWDRYLIPKPFSKNVVAYGEPFAVSEHMPDQAALEKIRASLDEVTAAADKVAGIISPSRA
jgi:lysophospholipid acyltransferase (LPLAT)-like uncharacterized protein